MIKSVIKSLLLLFIAAAANAQFQKTSDTHTEEFIAEKINGWRTIEDNSFFIQYPPGWELNQSGQMNTIFILLAPLSSDKDSFRENVNLIIQDLSAYGNMSLEKYTELSVNQVKTMLTNGIILENKNIHLPNTQYQKITYSGDQGGFHLRFEQYYWIENKKAFVLSLTGEADQFDAYKPTGEMILNSFALKKN